MQRGGGLHGGAELLPAQPPRAPVHRGPAPGGEAGLQLLPVLGPGLQLGQGQLQLVPQPRPHEAAEVPQVVPARPPAVHRGLPSQQLTGEPGIDIV